MVTFVEGGAKSAEMDSESPEAMKEGRDEEGEVFEK